MPNKQRKPVRKQHRRRQQQSVRSVNAAPKPIKSLVHLVHPNPSNYLRAAGFSGGVTKSTEVKRFTYTSSKVATVSINVGPDAKPAAELIYSIPRTLTVYFSSPTVSQVRAFAILGTATNDNIIQRTDIRVVAQNVQKLKLTIDYAAIAAHIDLEDANAKLPLFVIETTGMLTLTGKATFEHARGLAFPALAALASSGVEVVEREQQQPDSEIELSSHLNQLSLN